MRLKPIVLYVRAALAQLGAEARVRKVGRRVIQDLRELEAA